jgi:ribonuclease-3
MKVTARALSELQQKINYNFKDVQLLERALTHASALMKVGSSDYERLEFLGDAVMDLAVAHMLSDIFTEDKEGELTKKRAALICTNSLADVARTIGLGEFIRLGANEESSGGAARPSILADVVEAVVGAVYRDGGYDAAFVVVKGLLGERLTCVQPSDPKTELQEEIHAGHGKPAEYLLEIVEGPEHAPTFVSVVKIGDEILGRGRGTSKKASQQAAAAEAIVVVKQRRVEAEAAAALAALNPTPDAQISGTENTGISADQGEICEHQ